MSFANIYYKRATGTAKGCFVCDKPTTTVLATINTVDFLYTCPNHLTDPEFATLSPSEKLSVSAEEIARVKAEWEEKLAKKKLEKEKEKEEDHKTANEKDKDAKKTGDGSKQSDSTNHKGPQLPSTTTPSPKPLHEKYVLHRHYFAMRQEIHRKRRLNAQAKDLAPRLPGAPKGNI